jgi:uncharacterized membrane protein YgcG
MRPVNAPVRKTVIAVTAVAALSGAGIAAPAIVSAATDDRPTGRSVVDVADDQVRKEQGRHHREPGDDRSNDVNETDDSGFDSPHDRAERTSPDGRHLEPGDDHGDHLEPGDDDGGDNDSSGHGGGGADSSGHGGGDDSSGHGGGDD